MTEATIKDLELALDAYLEPRREAIDAIAAAETEIRTLAVQEQAYAVPGLAEEIADLESRPEASDLRSNVAVRLRALKRNIPWNKRRLVQLREMLPKLRATLADIEKAQSAVAKRLAAARAASRELTARDRELLALREAILADDAEAQRLAEMLGGALRAGQSKRTALAQTLDTDRARRMLDRKIFRDTIVHHALAGYFEAAPDAAGPRGRKTLLELPESSLGMISRAPLVEQAGALYDDLIAPTSIGTIARGRLVAGSKA